MQFMLETMLETDEKHSCDVLKPICLKVLKSDEENKWNK